MPSLLRFFPRGLQTSKVHLNTQKIDVFSMSVGLIAQHPAAKITADVTQFSANTYATFCETTSSHEKIANAVTGMLTLLSLVFWCYKFAATIDCPNMDDQDRANEDGWLCTTLALIYYFRNGLNLFLWPISEVSEPATPQADRHTVHPSPAAPGLSSV